MCELIQHRENTQNLLWPQNCLLLIYRGCSCESLVFLMARLRTLETIRRDRGTLNNAAGPAVQGPSLWGWSPLYERTWLSPSWWDCVQAYIEIPSSGSQAFAGWDLAHWIRVHSVWQHPQLPANASGLNDNNPFWNSLKPRPDWGLWMAF